MMEIFLCMALGVVLGRWFPPKLKRANELTQNLSILCLIFIMGVSLGNTEGFLSNLAHLGLVSFLYALFPVIFSLLFVVLFCRFLPKKEKKL